MKPITITKKQNTILIPVIYILFALGSITAGAFYYQQYENNFRIEVERQLSAIAGLKVAELEQYRKERLGDGDILLNNASFSSLVARFFENPQDGISKDHLRVWLDKYQQDFAYEQVFLLDMEGAQRMAVPDGSDHVAQLISSNIQEITKSGKVIFQDFYLNENDQRVYLAILVPIFDEQNSRRLPLGLVVLRINPKDYLYPYISRWPTPSQTAETMLIRRDGNDALFLNDLKFQKNTALKLRSPLTKTNLIAVQATLGQEGIVEGIDYRGISVIADVRAVPNSPWYLVARMDTSEVYGPLRERLWITIGMVGVLLFSIGLGVWLVLRQQNARYYQERYESQRELIWLQEVIARSLNEVFVFDAQSYLYKFANAGACRNTGYNLEELIHLTPVDIKPEFTQDSFRAKLQPLQSGEQEIVVFETKHRRKDGSEYPIEVHIQLVDSGEGKVFLALVNDISERKQAEKTLFASEQRYHLLFENMLNGFAYCRMLYDDQNNPQDFVYIDVNEAFETLTGLKNVVGKNVSELIPGIKEISPELFASYSRVALSGIPEKFDYDFKPLSIWLSISVYSLEKGTFAAIFENITEQKQAQEFLQESERRLRRAEEIGHLGHWRLDLVTNQLTWSDEMYKIFGVNQVNFQPTYLDLLQLVHPEDRIYHDQILEMIRTAGKADFAYRVNPPDGGLRYVTGYGELLTDRTGNPLAMFGIVLDVTELRQKERELQEKNAELERFTYMVSHDLKSPLVTIKTFLGYLEQDIAHSDMERIQKDMFFMHTAADKMGRLLDELLVMSRIGRVINPPLQVALNDLIQEALSMVAGQITERGVEVKVTSAASFDLVGDRSRLVEIWQNLIENAIKFMGDQAAPQIEIGVEQRAQEYIFYVRDNGIGIDPRYHEKIFGLFEKLDSHKEGTGLGLAMVKRIVELYNGRIWFVSQGLGTGTCFNFTLPEAIGK